MRIAIVGTGYVGLVVGGGLADLGQTVTCVDIERAKIRGLQRAKLPIYEPGLQELIKRNVSHGRLGFSTEVGPTVRDSEIVFLCVGTGATANGFPDLTQLWSAVDLVARSLNDYKIIAIKSTVPVGTAAKMEQRIAKRLGRGKAFDIVSNPEFLREGAAVSDFFHPFRVVIGTRSDRAAAALKELYRPLYLVETPFVFTTWETAELIKYATNCFLALKVSFVNELANLCDSMKATIDVHDVVRALALDPRVSPKFLHPGPGFGGYCFPKDTRALLEIAKSYGAEFKTVEAAIAANDVQYRRVLAKLEEGLGKLAGKTIAVLGLSFKPDTDDIRGSRALLVCKSLLAEGSTLRVFDPVAMERARRVLGEDSVAYCSDGYKAASRAHATVICTEWNQFRNLNLSKIKQVMAGNVLVDAKNILDLEKAKALGFRYFGMGRR